MPEQTFMTVNPDVPIYWAKFTGMKSQDAAIHICQVGVLLNCQHFTKVPKNFRSGARGCHLVDVQGKPACDNCPLSLEK